MTAAEFAQLLNARRVGRGRWKAKCPSHPDRTPSLSITEGRKRPIVYDLYTGLHGWLEAFLEEGYRCVGFDIEDMCASLGKPRPEGIEFRQRDVRSIHGSELKDAAVIVASPPCQAYSYRAMPWKRAKALPPPDNTLFNECFRIQQEAIAAAGHYIPLIVENVRGAQPWVGRAQWNYGSFYLWGDVPALMPKSSPRKIGGFRFDGMSHGSFQSAAVALYMDRDSEGIKQHGSGHVWYRTGNGALPSASKRRKAASAMIAKIPRPLAQHIARTFKP